MRVRRHEFGSWCYWWETWQHKHLHVRLGCFRGWRRSGGGSWQRREGRHGKGGFGWLWEREGRQR